MAETIFSFYRQFYPVLWRSLKVRRQIMKYNSITTRVYHQSNRFQLFVHIFDHYLEEADQIIDLISQVGLDKKKNYLEVGGGLGLVYGYLRYKGYKIFSCEPAVAGYDNVFNVGREILKIIKVKDDGWRPYLASGVSRFKSKFDVIFSNNVLEHIQNLRDSLLALKLVMRPGGIMVHNTVNYWVPYDPHYRIMVFPFFPALTSLFAPKLRSATLWRGLNFITPWQIYRLSQSLGLKLKFLPGRLKETIKRLEAGSEFGKRHHRWKRYLPLLKLFIEFPPIFQTPLTFTLERKR